MQLVVLKHFNNERVKPAYHMNIGDKILLTARISKPTDHVLTYAAMPFSTSSAPAKKPTDKESGLYFLTPVAAKNPMWTYTFKGLEPKSYGRYKKFIFAQELANPKGPGVIENKLFYNSFTEDNLRDLVVLYER